MNQEKPVQKKICSAINDAWKFKAPTRISKATVLSSHAAYTTVSQMNIMITDNIWDVQKNIFKIFMPLINLTWPISDNNDHIRNK